MRADAACENRVAVVEQVVCCDGGGRKRASLGDILRRLFRGDVFKNDFQLRKVLAQRNQLGFDKDRFAVKQINLAVCDFAVNQQRHASALHRFERAIRFAQIGHACVAVGGCASGIEFERDNTGFFGALDFIGWCVVGQIKRHERLKLHAGGHGGLDTLFVGRSQRCGGHGRFEVGHHNGAGELRGSVGHHSAKRIAITQMHMPIVGASEGELLGHPHIVLDGVG